MTLWLRPPVRPWVWSGSLVGMDERRLDGGFDGGATVVDGTVRRMAGPWSPSVHRRICGIEGSTGLHGPWVSMTSVARLSATCRVRRSVVAALGRHGLTATRRWCRLPDGCAGSTTLSWISLQGSKPCGARVGPGVLGC